MFLWHMALWNNDLLVFRRLFKIKSYFLSTFHGLFEYSFAQDNIYGMWHLETYVFFCCLSGSGATKVASDVDETLPLENPGEAIQAAKAAADSLEVPDTQPRPDLDDIFSCPMKPGCQRMNLMLERKERLGLTQKQKYIKVEHAA